MFCKNCGQEIDDQAVVCPHCGVAQNTIPTAGNDDTGSYGWAVLGCCIPVVGLILYLVWKDTKPLNAKKAGMGALIAVVCAVIYYVLMIILGIGLGMMS
jgi:uncharacterized membrane protein YvbJ